ncbi:hypothetical protein GE061_000658 [Apolygus lucorum]|uniref:HTH psq-type domain-containing protein n=1 Tax=Apolygus lucorum TaxID=248454 RepID=A0A8S9Y4Y5_APOLU|nr:hypothetical protein GE061_000658 [Apolygus lucorum]
MLGKRNTRFAETEDAVQENGSNDTDGTGKVSSKGNKIMKYSFETLQKALQLIKDGQISISEAARSFGIAKSTLHTKLTGKRPLVTKMGPATYLTAEEENEIKSWILNKAKLGFPLCREDVKDSIQNVLVKCPRETAFVNNRPGEKWILLTDGLHSQPSLPGLVSLR